MPGGCGGLDADDLFQEGLVAAIGAAGTWRADGGASLKTHCLTRGVGEMKDAIRRASRDHRKDNRTGRLYRIAAVVHVSTLVRAINRELRYDGRGYADPEFAAREEAAVPSRSQFARALRRLPQGQPGARDIALMYFADGMTIREIGRALGLSDSRVSQMLTSLLVEVRKSRTEREAAELLGLS